PTGVIVAVRRVDAIAALFENLLCLVPTQVRVAGENQRRHSSHARGGAGSAAEAVRVVTHGVAARGIAGIVTESTGAIGRPNARRAGGIAVIARERAPG